MPDCVVLIRPRGRHALTLHCIALPFLSYRFLVLRSEGIGRRGGGGREHAILPAPPLAAPFRPMQIALPRAPHFIHLGIEFG